MADTAERALRLLSILQSRRTWSGQELTDRLEVSERTLRRDIERLRTLGYRVDSTTGFYGGYELRAAANIPPLVFDDEEALAIAIGLIAASREPIIGIDEASLRALSKMEQVLPPRVRGHIGALQRSQTPPQGTWSTIPYETLTVVARACRDQEHMRFDYQSRSGAASERHVEPHRLVSLHRRWYLLAFDRDRDDWRSFRLDRIEDPRGTRIRFKPRPVPRDDASAYIEESFPNRYKVVATLNASADRIARDYPPIADQVEPIDEQHCRYTSRGDSLQWLTINLIWLNVDFQIHQPPELVEHLAGLTARLGNATVRS